MCKTGNDTDATALHGDLWNELTPVEAQELSGGVIIIIGIPSILSKSLNPSFKPIKSIGLQGYFGRRNDRPSNTPSLRF